MATVTDPRTGQLVTVPDRPPGQGPGVVGGFPQGGGQSLPFFAQTSGPGPSAAARQADAERVAQFGQQQTTAVAQPPPGFPQQPDQPGDGGFVRAFGGQRNATPPPTQAQQNAFNFAEALMRDPAQSQQFIQGLNTQAQRLAEQGLRFDPTRNMVVPIAGTIGAEAALNLGLGQGIETLQGGAAQGRQDILGATDQGIGALDAAQRLIGQQFNQGQGFLGQAGTDIGQQIGQGVSALDPFRTGGLDAQQLQLARSGALGPEAQAQAFAQFQASPGQGFLEEQGRRQLLAGAAATGGTQGGNVLKELTRFGQGLATQDLQRQFENLGTLSQQGLTAGGQIGQLRGQQAGLTSQLGQAGAQLSGQQAGLTGQLGQSRADIFGTQGVNLADISRQLSQDVGGAQFGTAQQIAAGRTQQGQLVAVDDASRGAGIADLIAQQGAGGADILDTGTINTVNTIINQAIQQGASQEELATLLANLRLGVGTTAGGASAAQLLESGDISGDIAATAGGIGAAIAAFSDIRLKENIKPIGTTDKGYTVYLWDWTGEALDIVGDQPAIGVMAQDIMRQVPDAVTTAENGYLQVDYRKLI